MSNHVKYYIRGSLWTVVLLFVSGGIIQTFFGEIGFSARQIGSYTSLISVVQMAVMILSIFVADSIKKVKDTIALLSLSPILLCSAMLLPCFSEKWNGTAVFYLALLFCCIQNFFTGFSNVLCYRLPYLIIDMKDYAKLENTNAIFSGILSILVSGLITFLSTIFSFRRIMAAGFCLSILFCICSSFLLKSMKPRKEFENAPEQGKFSFQKLGKKEFCYFYIPNFLRGCAMGLMSIMTVICMKEVNSDASVVSSLAVLLSVASIAGSGIYQLLKKKMCTASLYMTGSLSMCLLLPVMLTGKSAYVFCTLYFFICIGYSIINIAGAVYATEVISYQDIGTYTSVRLIIMTLGQAVASYGISVLMDHVSTTVLMALCGMAQLVSGIMYDLYDKKEWGNLYE